MDVQTFIDLLTNQGATVCMVIYLIYERRCDTDRYIKVLDKLSNTIDELKLTILTERGEKNE